MVKKYVLPTLYCATPLSPLPYAILDQNYKSLSVNVVNNLIKVV